MRLNLALANTDLSHSKAQRRNLHISSGKPHAVHDSFARLQVKRLTRTESHCLDPAPSRRRKIMPFRVTPNARICLNLAKENPHSEQITRQIVFAEQFCLNSVIFHSRGVCEPA